MARASLLAWHFLPASRRLTHGDGRRVEAGQKLTMPDEPIAMAGHGFHASVRVLDALHHAPGAVVCRVEMGGEILEDTTRIVASERKVLWMGDASRALHEFSVWCAEQALQLAEAPDPRSVRALELKRRWLAGEVSDDALGQAWANAYAAVSEAPDHRLSCACLTATYASTPATDTVSQSARDSSQEALNMALYCAETDGVATAEERKRVCSRCLSMQNQVLEGLIERSLGST